ncbi:MAG: ATP-binding protein [Planctomycetota bacterium]|jgi:PAS domain S-box-containing protein
METETIEKECILAYKDVIKVLLVEDNAADCRLVERILGRYSWSVEFEVDSVGSLSDAVEMLNNSEHDVVLLDLGLPDSSGVEAVQTVNRINPHIPIVVLTASDSEQEGLAAIESGASDFLTKGQATDNAIVRTILYALARKREIENWWRTFDAISDLVFVLDANFTITKSNKAFVEVLGAKSEDLIGRKCYEILHHRDTPWPDCPVEKTLADRRPHVEEVDDPNIGIPLLVSTSPIFDDRGELIGSIQIARDITESKKAEKLARDANRRLQETSRELLKAKQELDARHRALEDAHRELETRVKQRTAELSEANNLLKTEIDQRLQAEENLRTSESNLRKVIAADPDGIAIINGDGVVCFANPAAESLFGLKEGEIPAETFGFPLEFKEESEIEILHETKGLRVAQTHIVNIEWEGKPSYLASLHDITEQKRAEEKLKEAIRMKSEFVSTASHELRTPLTAIKEAVRLVIQEKTGKLNNEQKEFLGIVQRNTERLSRLTSDVLDFQKLENGKIKINMQENDVNEIVSEIAATMSSYSNRKNLYLATDLDESLPKVRCDRDKITQVLTNIVGNAIKFTEEGGVTISTTQSDNIIQVSVADTGPGIEEEDMPKLFKEFEQISNGSDENDVGTGLGLAISRKLIKKHNAKIWVESEPGKGTTFHFVLPIKERRAKERN